MKKEISAADRLVEKITKVRPTLFRPPFGITNPNIENAVQKSGLKCVGWNLRSLDTVISNPVKLLNRLKRKTRSGAIVLLHDNRSVTLEVLEKYILFLKAENYVITNGICPDNS